MSENRAESSVKSTSSAFGLLSPAIEYATDAAQRTILFWDVMRQRGNAYREHLSETAPHVQQARALLDEDPVAADKVKRIREVFAHC